MWRFGIIGVMVAVGIVALAPACGPPPSADAGRDAGPAEPYPCPAEPTRQRGAR